MAGKRGSLELSINAIVIIVLAFILLGLGLGFIRSQFKGIKETTGQVQEQVRQQILEDLRTGDKKLSFPSERVLVDKGGVKDLAIGIKNVLPSGNLNFYIDIYTAQLKGFGTQETTKCSKKVEVPEDIGSNENIVLESGSGECPITDIDYFLQNGPFTLGAAEAEVYAISLTAGKSQGTYLVKIDIYQAEMDQDGNPTGAMELYAEKTFFVQVV